jgi:cell division transport system permease protein
MSDPTADEHNGLAVQSAPKRDMPLIPGDTVAERALVVVIAIMTFLACLTAGGALLIADASQGWRSDVLRDVTVQIKPRPGDDIEKAVAQTVALASRTPGVKDARAYSRAESEKLLEPWLGQGLDMSQLPIPRLIIVHMRGGDAADVEALRAALAPAVPQASLDDHRVWAARMGTMADAVVLLAAALFVLMIVAMGTAIGFATRGAMAGNREIIEVLHFVGASDSFIADEFQTHFRRLGLHGALIGGLSAIAFFLATSALSFWWAHPPGGEEIAAMFGAFALGSFGYGALALVCAGVTLLTGLLSREIVYRHLQTLH